MPSVDNFPNPGPSLLLGSHGQQIVDALRDLDDRSRKIGNVPARPDREFIIGLISKTDAQGADSAFSDERYHVQAQTVLQGAFTDELQFIQNTTNYPVGTTVSGIGATLPTGTDGESNIKVVSNLAEWREGLHALLVGMPVMAMGWWDASGQKHYVMWETQPLVRVLLTGPGGPSDYLGNVLDGIHDPANPDGSARVGAYVRNGTENGSTYHGLSAGQTVLARVTYAPASGPIYVEIDGTIPSAGGWCTASSNVIFGAVQTLFHINDFTCTTVLNFGNGLKAARVKWLGFDVITNGQYGTSDFRGNVEIIEFDQNINTANVGTDYGIQWTLTDGPSARVAGACPSEIVTVAKLAASVKVPKLKVQDCNGGVIAAQTDILQFDNGFTVTNPGGGGTALVALKLIAGTGITISNLTGCGGVQISLAAVYPTWAGDSWIDVNNTTHVISHIGPDTTIASSKVTVTFVNAGTGFTATPHKIDIDSKGHVISDTADTPYTYTPPTYTPPTWTGDSWVDVNNATHVISHKVASTADGAQDFTPVTTLSVSGTTLTLSRAKAQHDSRGHFAGAGSLSDLTATLPKSTGTVNEPDTMSVSLSGSTLTITLHTKKRSLYDGSDQGAGPDIVGTASCP